MNSLRNFGALTVKPRDGRLCCPECWQTRLAVVSRMLTTLRVDQHGFTRWGDIVQDSEEPVMNDDEQPLLHCLNCGHEWHETLVII